MRVVGQGRRIERRGASTAATMRQPDGNVRETKEDPIRQEIKREFCLHSQNSAEGEADANVVGLCHELFVANAGLNV